MRYPIVVAMLHLGFAAIFATLAVLFRDDILTAILAGAVAGVFVLFAVIVVLANFGSKTSHR